MKRSLLFLKKTKPGSFSIFFAGFGFLILIFIIIGFCIIESTTIVGVDKLKAGSDFANLAVYKHISKEKLGDTEINKNKEQMIIFEERVLNDCLDTFKEYLSKNLGVDKELKPTKNKFLVDKLRIKEFIIYSVYDNRISEYRYDPESNKFIVFKKDYIGDIYTPNGKKVVKTSVFSQVGYSINISSQIYNNIITSYTDILKEDTEINKN